MARSRPEAELSAAIRSSQIKDLRPGERIVVERRRHPIRILIQGWWAILLFLSGLLATLVVFATSNTAPPLPITLGLFALVFGGALATAWFVLDWSNDYFILTNQRVIFLDRTIGVSETRSEAPLSKVHNVRIDILSPIANALSYGDLSLDTAGLGVLRFTMVSNPKQLERLIMDARKGVTESAGSSRLERRRTILRKVVFGVQDASDLPATAPYIAPRDSGLSSFNRIFPFAAQRRGETVIWHRHWFFLIVAAGLPFLLFIGLLVLLGIYTATVATYDPNASPPDAVKGFLVGASGWVSLFFFLAFAAVIGLLLYRFEDWRNDRYSLTHDRVILIDKTPLGLRETVKETLFDRITDVSYNLPSPLAMLLNYGTVEIKTPGEATVFNFEQVPDPRKVQQEIMTRLEARRQREQAQWDNDIVDWIGEYNRALGQVYGISLPESFAPTVANPNSGNQNRPSNPRLTARDDQY